MIRIRVDQRLAVGAQLVVNAATLAKPCSVVLSCAAETAASGGGCVGGVREGSGKRLAEGPFWACGLLPACGKAFCGSFSDISASITGKGLRPSVEGLLGVFGALLPPLLRVSASIIAAFGCPWWGQRLFFRGPWG